MLILFGRVLSRSQLIENNGRSSPYHRSMVKPLWKWQAALFSESCDAYLIFTQILFQGNYILKGGWKEGAAVAAVVDFKSLSCMISM